MATKRYRVFFKANFEITVDAACIQAAKTIALEMEKLPWGSWAAAADAHNVECGYRYIEPVDADP